jgi:tetratricopeptide (TPR) repeat protein
MFQRHLKFDQPKMALQTDGPAMAKRNQLHASTAFGLRLDPAKMGEQIVTSARAAPQVAASQTAGDSASKRSLKRIKSHADTLRHQSLIPLINRSLDFLKRDNYAKSTELALEVLDKDERNGLAWYLLAISKEKTGDLISALKCYESAFQLLDDPEMVASDLGRLAYRMNMKQIAEQLFRLCLVKDPTSNEIANNLACILRDAQRYDEAVDVLKSSLNVHPEDPLLWNTLGTVLSEQGEVASSKLFYEEALRSDPNFAKARYNLGNAHHILGDLDAALEACNAAMTGKISLDEHAMMQVSHSTMLMCLGKVGEGWDAYEARFDPNFADVLHFFIDRPKWTPEMDVRGKSILVIGEQGLGDEVLFGNLIPDLLKDIGPNGKLSLAVEERLVDLFQQSFPSIEVGAHVTFGYDHRVVRAANFVEDPLSIDAWAPLASLLRRYRRSINDFPQNKNFLTADPDRVAYWTDQLKSAPLGFKVGILWKSLRMDGSRLRSFSPFEQWRSVLETPGITFVNMQYGETEAEIAQAKADYGIDIWQPPGINLKDDLADVGALACALDLTLGFSNATTNIAAACGAPVWIISIPGAWTRLGTDSLPWYPQVRVFTPDAFRDWQPVMEKISDALTETLVSLP